MPVWSTARHNQVLYTRDLGATSTITGADLQTGQVMLTPPICTMGARAHVTQYNVFATLGNGVNRRFLVIVTVASARKSVTSLLVGIALDRGLLADLDAPVFSFFPEYDDLRTPEKDHITLRHLLTMSSGFAWDENSVAFSDPSNSDALAARIVAALAEAGYRILPTKGRENAAPRPPRPEPRQLYRSPNGDSWFLVRDPATGSAFGQAPGECAIRRSGDRYRSRRVPQRPAKS